MSEWWTYSLSDFLLFSPRTYYRLLELYNVAIWPLQVVTVVAGVAVIVSLRRRPEGNRVAPLVLASCWAWIAWAFHMERYAQINWAAAWFAMAFGVQAALLVAAGLLGEGVSLRMLDARASRWALLVALAIIVAYPLLMAFGERPWSASETFGTAPDPTALATLVLLMQLRGNARWIVSVIPFAWCVLGALTLIALESMQAYIVIALMLTALGLAATQRRADPRSR